MTEREADIDNIRFEHLIHGPLQKSPFRTREVVISLVPHGRLRRTIYELVSVKHLPGAYVVGAMISVSAIPVVIATVLTSQKGIKTANSAIAAIAANTEGAAQFVGIAFLIAILAVLVRILANPTHLGISPEGVRLHWRRAIVLKGRLLKWTDIQEIRLVQPRGTTSAEARLLQFVDAAAGAIAIKVGDIADPFQLKYLKDVLSACNVPRDFQAQQMLALEDNSSYTQIWMQALTAAPDRERLRPLPPGALVGDSRYTVEILMAVGGQGTAYLASRTSFLKGQEKVVLKEYVLPVQVSHAAKTQALERLEREARILKGIKHNQIVDLLDFFVEDHRGYLVLEYIDGLNLSRLVKTKGARSIDEVVDLSLQMCDILAYLHQLSPPVIHRDFTPDNLILSPDGKLKLIDFNVAEQRASTTTATIVGKHAYIAPEQFRGKPLPQSDIYSLGATISFLVTGKDPKPLTVARPGAQAGLATLLDDVAAACTAIDAAQRYANALEVKAALNKLRQTT